MLEVGGFASTLRQYLGSEWNVREPVLLLPAGDI